MVGGFVCKKGKQEGSFWKKGCKGRDFLVIRGKVGGFGQKALLFPLPTQNRGEGGALGAGVDPGALGDGGGRGRGQKREGTEGVRLPLLPRLGWSVEGGPRGPAAAVLGGSWRRR